MNLNIFIKAPLQERGVLELTKLASNHLLASTVQNWKWLLLCTFVSFGALAVLLHLNQFGLSNLVGYVYPHRNPAYWNDLERELYASFAGSILAYLVGYKVMNQSRTPSQSPTHASSAATSPAFEGLTLVSPTMACILALTAGFVASFFAFVGVLLLVLPGIYIVVATVYAPTFVFVRGLTPTQAVKFSWKAVHAPTATRKNGFFGENFRITLGILLAALLFGAVLGGLNLLADILWKRVGTLTLPFSLSAPTAISYLQAITRSFVSYFGSVFTFFLTLEFFADILAFSPVGQTLRLRSNDTEPSSK